MTKFIILMVSFFGTFYVYACECDIHHDTTGQFVIGQYTLGQTIDKNFINTHYLNEHCTNSDGIYYECEVIDMDIRYLIEENMIIRKDVALNESSADLSLPFGIQKNDSLIDVLTKIKALGDNEIKWSETKESTSLILSTGLCISGKFEEPYEFWLVFDRKNIIKEMGSRLNW